MKNSGKLIHFKWINSVTIPVQPQFVQGICLQDQGMPVQAFTMWKRIQKAGVMEAYGEGSWGTGWGGDLLSVHIFVLFENCSMCTHYPCKRQVEEEKSRMWIWRVNGRYLGLSPSLLQCLLCFTFFFSLHFLLQEYVLNS